MDYSAGFDVVFLADVKAKIDTNFPVFCDTETIDLYGKIRLVQFYQAAWEKPCIVHWPNIIELAALIKNIHSVWHSANYDISTIQDQLGKMAFVPDNFDCTLLLSRLHFYKELKFSLDNVITYVLGHNPYPNKKEMQGSDWNKPVLSDEQLSYAASDVYYLSLVYEAVKEQKETYSYKLDMIALKDALEFQCEGMPVDSERLEALYAKNTARIKEIGLPINCNSYQQTRAYINSNESDDLGLARLSLAGNERAKAVRETRKLVKLNSFLTKFQTDDGHIYGKFGPYARSGRFTCKDQNLQQLPRASKGVFGYPKNGDTVIIFSDFSQLELRCMCAIAADHTMERLMREGLDMHGYTTKLCIADPYTKPQRQVGKTCNFNLGYGGGAGMLSSIILTDADMYVSPEECSKLKSKWLKVYTGINAWQQQGIRDYRAGRAWQTPLGRRYVAELMTDQLNIQIQGFGAEVAKLARHYTKQKLIEAGLIKDVRQFNFVHDSYMLKAPNDLAVYEKAAKILGDSMKEAWFEMCKSADLVKIKDLPMPVEVEVGFNWGDIEAKEKNPEGVIYEYKC